MYGLPVVNVGYQFLLQTGAGQGASGQYITRLEVAPTNVDIAQGWNVDLAVAFQSPLEYGDAGALFAVLQAQMQLTIDTSIKRNQASKLHLVFPQGVIVA
jgi:predicted nucleic acid-binding protein